MSAFSDWLNSVNGRAVEMDKSWGAQCWDLWSHYAVNMIGATYYMTGTNAGSGGCPQHSGYTCGLWKGFNTSGLGTWFTPVQGPPQRGDVAIWDWGSPAGPNSHVAIVVEDRGNNVYCMTQNPGAAHYATLSKAGMLGYLRPDNQSFFDGPGAGSTPAATGSIADLAAAVIRGEFGNGPDRVAALGANYDAVQAEVNHELVVDPVRVNGCPIDGSSDHCIDWLSRSEHILQYGEIDYGHKRLQVDKGIPLFYNWRL